jgi:hypothetical protein
LKKEEKMMKHYKYYPLLLVLAAPLLMANHVTGHPSLIGNAILIGFLAGFALRLATRLLK